MEEDEDAYTPKCKTNLPTFSDPIPDSQEEQKKPNEGISSYRQLVDQIMSEVRLSDEVDDVPKAQMSNITKEKLKIDLSKLKQRWT